MLTYVAPEGDGSSPHERAARVHIAKTLAALKGYEFGGGYDAAARYGVPLYLVPSDTLVGIEAALALGVRGPQDLFGGVVPFACMGGKTISHPLLGPQAAAPPGWPQAFAERVRPVVLPGWSAFSIEDARRAGKLLLEGGSIRLKQGQGIGGKGQANAADPAALERALQSLDAGEVARYGLVVERNLEEATTFSVGQVCVADLLATYCGTQHMTSDNSGAPAYGGSDLFVVRGGYDALCVLPLAPEARDALSQARSFDAATEALAGFFASRRNYDVVRGRDDRGRWHCGVLEQSWRIGGASGAEAAALAAFRAEPQLRAVRARSLEVYGPGGRPPPGAIVHFCGVDELFGEITKYTLLEPL